MKCKDCNDISCKHRDTTKECVYSINTMDGMTELEIHIGQLIYGDAKRNFSSDEKQYLHLLVKDVIIPAAIKQIAKEIEEGVEDTIKKVKGVQL